MVLGLGRGRRTFFVVFEAGGKEDVIDESKSYALDKLNFKKKTNSLS